MDLHVWTFARDALANASPVFLAMVAHHTRHSPGTAGVTLALRQDGQTAGTIGGGVMEADVLTEGRQALLGGSFHTYPRVQPLSHRRNAPDHAAPSGLICAGHQTNCYALLNPATDLPLITEICDRIATDSPGHLHLSEQGLAMELSLRRSDIPPVFFEDQEPWRLTLDLQNWKRVAIIGGGHCGLALSRTLKHLGYRVTLFETRPDVFTLQKNEWADEVIVLSDFAEAGEQITRPEWTHVVVMTANLPSDVRGLLGTAELPFPYLGVMGAPAKLQRIKAELRELKVSEEALARLHAPIGLPMTSNTPEEIAISIAAEFLQLREDLFPFTKPSQTDLSVRNDKT